MNEKNTPAQTSTPAQAAAETLAKLPDVTPVPAPDAVPAQEPAPAKVPLTAEERAAKLAEVKNGYDSLFLRGADRGRRLGELLADLRDDVNVKGEDWAGFVATNLPFDERYTRQLIQLNARWEKVAPHFANNPYLSIGKAIALTQVSKVKTPSKIPAPAKKVGDALKVLGTDGFQPIFAKYKYRGKDIDLVNLVKEILEAAQAAEKSGE